ncbi:MAG: mechanosensitive ion channel family protein [Parahaliea sp.]
MQVIEEFINKAFHEWQGSGAFTSSIALLVGAVVLHLLLRLTMKQLLRVADHSSHRWDDVVVAALEMPLRAVLWVLVVYLLLDINTLGQAWRKMAVQAYDTALVLLLIWFFQRLIRGVEEEILHEERGQKGSYDKATVHAIAKLLRIILWIIGGLMVLQSLNVSISGLLAFGGVGGIAVGFAAKDLLANFFGAISIYLDRPFTPGDWIRSPDREIEGTVEDIGWRLTRIRTFDQRPLYVPNAIFSQIAVENPSRMLNRRIYETIGLRYSDSAVMEAVINDVRNMLKQHPAIDSHRTLIVNFVSFGDSALNFFIYTFTKTTVWVEYHAIKQDVMLKIIDIVHAQGADFAFPSRSLYVSQADSDGDAPGDQEAGISVPAGPGSTAS